MDKTLRFIADKLTKNNIKWFLGGSGALMVNGVKITPHDLDFFIDTKDFDKVVRLFLVTKIHDFNKNYLPVRNFQLNFNFNVEFYEKDLSHKRLIQNNYHGLSIPTNPLEVELEYYRERPGKEDTVSLIETKLKEIKTQLL